MLFFKAFRDDGTNLHAHNPKYNWPQPFPRIDARRPGEWTHEVGNLFTCRSGWHLAFATPRSMTSWVNTNRQVYLAEIAEGSAAAFSYHFDKFVVSEARLVRRLSHSEVARIVEVSRVITVTAAVTTPLRLTGILPEEEVERLYDGAAWVMSHVDGQRIRHKRLTVRSKELV